MHLYAVLNILFDLLLYIYCILLGLVFSPKVFLAVTIHDALQILPLFCNDNKYYLIWGFTKIWTFKMIQFYYLAFNFII